MGTTIASSPAPYNPDTPLGNIESDIEKEPNIPGVQMIGRDIEADIEAEMNKAK
jgi:hypothetical protein